MPILPPSRFQKLVFKWFDHFGRKTLPWQKNKTPYSVWVSEIMLQQTQVSTVIPYYQKFLQRFPNLGALALAKEDEVLHQWTGLGYYSRARNLHRSAKLIQEKYQGKFPDQLEQIQELPGIGRSTAGAILSCAFHKRAPILDGNVKRLLSRYHALSSSIDDKATLDQLWLLAEKYTPKERNSDYSQVMMDLGATLCTRRNPRCSACPLAKSCQAYQLGLVELIPAKNKKAALPVKQSTFLILKHKNKVLLQKRPAKGLWGGLWSLPEISKKLSLAEAKRLCCEQFKVSIKDAQTLKAFRHSFTHFHLDILPFCLELAENPSKKLASPEQIWYSLHRPKALGLPKPVLSILGELA